MKAMFDKEQLQSMLRDFYELSGLRTVIFDEWDDDLQAYPSQMPDFCRLIRRSPNGRKACKACDRESCIEAKRTKQTLIYRCHAGLTEVVTPIIVGDTTVAYLRFGHICLSENEQSEWETVRECCRGLDITVPELFAAHKKLTRTSEPKLKAAANLLTIAAAGLYQKKLAMLLPGTPADNLNRYLSENIDKDISSNSVCDALGIGRTALYKLSVETYGCGISEQIMRLRIRRACQLLADTEMSNSQISRLIGVNDYNYFSKIFKRETGYTPRSYRNQFRVKTKEVESDD